MHGGSVLRANSRAVAVLGRSSCGANGSFARELVTAANRWWGLRGSARPARVRGWDFFGWLAAVTAYGVATRASADV